MSEIRAEVTFMLTDGSEQRLRKRAQLLGEEEYDTAEEYTLLQALQVVWHHDPEWLHANVLEGWVLERGAQPDGPMQEVWR